MIEQEEWEQYAEEHGLAALLDHLGLDGYANEVVRLHLEIIGLREDLDKVYAKLSMPVSEQTSQTIREIWER